MTGGGLHVGCYQHVICLLHNIGVVLQIVTLDILGRPPAIIAALDNDRNDHNDNDDSDATANAGDDNSPLKMITG